MNYKTALRTARKRALANLKPGAINGSPMYVIKAERFKHGYGVHPCPIWTTGPCIIVAYYSCLGVLNVAPWWDHERQVLTAPVTLNAVWW